MKTRDTRTRYYVASKPRHAPMWRDLEVQRGVRIVATWIYWPGEALMDDDVADALAARCLEDVFACDTLVLYEDVREGDSSQWTGALIEMGAALALGEKVIAVVTLPTRSRLDIWARHPNFTFADSLEEAFNLNTPTPPAP